MRRLLYLWVLLLAGGCGLAAPSVTRTPDPAFLAPDFQLTTLEGETLRLSDLRGQWVILNFWATWCEPCVRELPDLIALAQETETRLLAINMREDEATVRAFLAKHQLELTVLMSPDDATLAAYQVLSLPQTVLIHPIGEIHWRQFGLVNPQILAAQLEG
jgi:peroxiredoxin